MIDTVRQVQRRAIEISLIAIGLAVCLILATAKQHSLPVERVVFAQITSLIVMIDRRYIQM